MDEYCNCYYDERKAANVHGNRRRITNLHEKEIIMNEYGEKRTQNNESHM